MDETEYLIIGGGPTGLGAAARLQEKELDWSLLEAEPFFGGLAHSFKDEEGFTWDCGGHVQFSHYDTFDRYMDLALGADGWYTHERESWVWIKKRFVPYPFQNNLHRLDPQDRWAAVKGLLRATELAARGIVKPENFEAWMLATFGEGVTDLFMRPYNFKVWAFPPKEMDYHWIGERVSVPKLEAVLKGICTDEDEVSWGPNSVFRFPKKGGTGAVWEAIGR
ncbi:MAG: NAD(P)-binding protein, partial [Verrucomicrobia bacterium]|nr:NAD(P)-binding protein [Verrucomicrobiota bacterium]